MLLTISRRPPLAFFSLFGRRLTLQGSFLRRKVASTRAGAVAPPASLLGGGAPPHSQRQAIRRNPISGEDRSNCDGGDVGGLLGGRFHPLCAILKAVA